MPFQCNGAGSTPTELPVTCDGELVCCVFEELLQLSHSLNRMDVVRNAAVRNR
jgi:hypothetical protein